jgi:hypothetical protein
MKLVSFEPWEDSHLPLTHNKAAREWNQVFRDHEIKAKVGASQSGTDAQTRLVKTDSDELAALQNLEQAKKKWASMRQVLI